MKKLAVTLVTLFMATTTFGQDFNRFQTFEENAKGKQVMKLKKGQWLLEDCLSEENIHIRNFTYMGDSISEKVSIMATQHNIFEYGGDMVDHVGSIILDDTRQKYLGQNHLFLYRKENLKNEIYAVVWLKADGTEMYFEVEG